jgi:hypothetical protein
MADFTPGPPVAGQRQQRNQGEQLPSNAEQVFQEEQAKQAAECEAAATSENAGRHD